MDRGAGYEKEAAYVEADFATKFVGYPSSNEEGNTVHEPIDCVYESEPSASWHVHKLVPSRKRLEAVHQRSIVSV